MSDQQLLERVACDPKVMVGKPVIKGTRLTVEFILNLLAHGSTIEEILNEYEGLAVEDIMACLLFASQSLSSTAFMPLDAESAWMRFLVDECTGPTVAQWLRDQAHEVLSVHEEARGMVDDDILDKAHDEERILITNDKDFGEKVYPKSIHIME